MCLMWSRRINNLKWNAGFFLVCLSTDTLYNYYRIMFELEHDHHLDAERLENMMPWEFEVQVSLLMENMKRKAEQRAAQQ